MEIKVSCPLIGSYTTVAGVGYGQAIATSSVVSYYTCLIALSVYYLFASFAYVLPWTICNPDYEEVSYLIYQSKFLC